ncbi:hypothetical protein [Paragemmobacter straminiformis]|uniref:Sulfotransferase family protein n=1 Tax=Paragemmobacter straminiformis TaxID=2045119 RepID=A0A842I6E5_9RHOB|nr:hypothetical protein [Gemmobacter straminiformis]MBC2835219.1 hypothetical protein [Gemmobacter straminiformis]
MRIVYHLGAHCTDEERLIRCLWKNRATLGHQGIVVPGPTRYRALLRDTAITLKGRAASRDTQALVLDQIMDEDRADRLILSWDNFLSYPQWAIRDRRLYPAAGERIRAFTQIFPEIEAEFHLAIRNPASFLPALFAKQRGKPYEEFIGTADPRALSWSRMVEEIRTLNPDAPLTIWCDEDTPLIWPEVLQNVSGHAPDTQLAETDELLTSIMSPEGLTRMNGYLSSNPPSSVAQRRRIVSAFLDKFALPDQIETEFELPGWDESLLDDLNSGYQRDITRIRQMEGVTFLAA